MKVCVITCYNDPDYVRARALRGAVDLINDAELITVKNKRKGLLRYPEVLLRVLAARLKHAPDVYVLTFRGYEVLLPIRIITAGKALVYDEFINPIEWAALEHKKIAETGLAAKIIRLIYTLSLRGKYLILTDTKSHATLSSRLMHTSIQKYVHVYVGTDEKIFNSERKSNTDNNNFTVFYYGNMLPLHGINHVIEAALLVNDLPVTFELVGGNKTVADKVHTAKTDGANIIYKSWVNFEKLPDMMAQSDLCLAGPFGGTLQSEYVITGKAFQYMAMGRPIVIGFNKESGVFTDKKDALIVEQASAKSLADAIRWAYHHKDDLKDIGLRGKKLFESEFSSGSVARQLSAALEKVFSN